MDSDVSQFFCFLYNKCRYPALLDTDQIDDDNTTLESKGRNNT
jgi:hypothetical protein